MNGGLTGLEQYEGESLIASFSFMLLIQLLGRIYLFRYNETCQVTSSSCLYSISREHQVVLRCQANAHVWQPHSCMQI